MESTPVNLQPITGTVVKVSDPHTIRVTYKVTKVHPLYRKRYTLSKYVVAHDPNSSAKVGDIVTVVMCRPISKTKRWTIAQ